MPPYFSIITPTYNRGPLLARAIESVLQQSFLDFELIIVDDASTDQTPQIISSYSDSRIKYIRNNKNLERGASRNIGIEKASGRFICFLDSDDRYEKHHLEGFWDEIEKLEFEKGLLFCNAFNEFENGERERRVVPPLKGNIFAYILRYTFNPTRVCVHNEILQELKFDPSIPGLEDLDLWLRIATKYPVYQVFNYSVVYFLHKDSYSDGDAERFKKELSNFTFIFNKPELKEVLPANEKRRLLSMCYFHLSLKYDAEGKKRELFNALFNSFFLYPQGYNGRTNKILLVKFLYNLPLGGPVFKALVKLVKQK